MRAKHRARAARPEFRSPGSGAGDGAGERSAPRLAEFSVPGEVPVHFPGRDVPDVVEPLLALRLDEVVEDVLAERLPYEVVLLQLVERLAQVARQLVDPQMASLPVAHLVDVLVHRRAGEGLLLCPPRPPPEQP